MNTVNIKIKKLIQVFTWTPSTSQRSPTSYGCITNRKMIASKTVLHVFPNINTTKRIWELMNTRKWVIGIPSIMNQVITIITPTRMFNKLWSSSTAVFVSLRDNDRALLSLNAVTWRKTDDTFLQFMVHGLHTTERALYLFCFSRFRQA